jgi:hypothetical protein
MRLFLVLIVVAVIGVWLARRQRAALSLWWTRTGGAWRAWLSHALGSTPTFGSLQRAVLAEALRQRTVSVTGSVWLPSMFEVDMAEVDRDAIGHAPGPFLIDLGEALTSIANASGWRLEAPVQVTFSDRSTAKPGLPKVTVRASAPPTAGPATTPTPPPAPAPPPARPAPGAPADLPPTEVVAATERTFVEADVTVPAGHPVGAPGLLLDPEEGDGPPIVVSRSATGTVIGRTSRADVVVPEPTVSAQHCRLIPDGSGWCIEDLGSSNGTVVNGERISGRHPLVPGDVVTLGSRARYRVHA